MIQRNSKETKFVCFLSSRYIFQGQQLMIIFVVACLHFWSIISSLSLVSNATKCPKGQCYVSILHVFSDQQPQTQRYSVLLLLQLTVTFIINTPANYFHYYLVNLLVYKMSENWKMPVTVSQSLWWRLQIAWFVWPTVQNPMILQWCKTEKSIKACIEKADSS